VSDLPIAAGLSSSSALVVAIAFSLSAINRLAEREEFRRNIDSTENLAEYMGCIEAGFDYHGLAGDVGVGTLSGCEDQTAMLCAQPATIIQYAFCPVRFERRLLFPADCVLAIASSGLRAEKAGGAMEKYNSLSRKARAITDVWHAATGRREHTIADVLASTSEAADELRQYLAARSAGMFSSEELLQRLEQFIGESDVIIPAASDAIARGDLSTLRLLVEQSVDGADRLLRNQVPETLALTGLARELGAVAASPFGAGFGGSVWALVKEAASDTFLADWQARYLKRFPERASSAEFFLTRAGPPASCVA
jgi:galactokinase